MLTTKQLKLYNYLKKSFKDNSVSPSFEEMKIALGLKSKSGIHRLINALEERGFIKRLHNKARAIKIINQNVIEQKKMRIIMRAPLKLITIIALKMSSFMEKLLWHSCRSNRKPRRLHEYTIRYDKKY